MQFIKSQSVKFLIWQNYVLNDQSLNIKASMSTHITYIKLDTHNPLVIQA
jgi:hypothetical protein